MMLEPMFLYYQTITILVAYFVLTRNITIRRQSLAVVLVEMFIS